MKKILIPILMFIFLISIVNATTLFEDSFDYSDDFDLNGWTYSTNCGHSSHKEFPIPSTNFTTNAFGFNTINGCGITSTRYIYRNLEEKAEDGIITFEYDHALLNDSTLTSKSLVFAVYNRPNIGGSKFFSLQYTNETMTTANGDFDSFQDCNVNFAFNTTILFPYSFNTRLVVDLDNQVYTVMFNDIIMCNEHAFTGGLNVSSVYIANQVDASELLVTEFDNLVVSGENISGAIYGVNEPCESNADCLTDYCSGGTCQKKLGLVTCSSNFECLSGDCVNGKCLKPSAGQQIDQLKNETLGDDSNTNNLLAIMISIILMFIIFNVGKEQNSRAIMVGGVGVFFVSMFYFLLIGWLSFFIGFILFLVVIIGAFIVIFLGKGGE